MSRIKWFEYADVWDKVKRAARTTISKEGAGKTPTRAWKKQALLSEHSMIRKIRFGWKWTDLFSWVSVHFVRHKFGIEHWVTTQRTDRTGIDRNAKRQDAPVEHECDADVQAVINMARKRLCNQASVETRAAFQQVVEEIRKADPIIADVLVPECIYRGFCPEFNCCGYVKSAEYAERLTAYRNVNV